MKGGASHGRGFSNADREGAICLDVLDACFSPAPSVIRAYHNASERIGLSPELEADSLREAISEARGLEGGSIGLGAGSSDIIHRVFGSMCGPDVLVLDPTYSEYRFVASMQGSRVHSIALKPEEDFLANVDQIVELARSCSDVVLVNPNNPTGKYLTRSEILEIRQHMPPQGRLWVDEAYIDYCPPGTSIEQDVSQVPNLFVLKTLSKSYALSGLRVAYWVGRNARDHSTPPWIISQPGVACAVAALGEEHYYRSQRTETISRAKDFEKALQREEIQTWSGNLNAVLIRDGRSESAGKLSEQLASVGMIVRTSQGMGEALSQDFVRISLPKLEVEPLVIERFHSVF